MCLKTLGYQHKHCNILLKCAHVNVYIYIYIYTFLLSRQTYYSPTTVCSSQDRERELVSKLLSEAYPNILSSSQIGKGFQRLFEIVDDIQIDAPAARQMIAAFLARCVFFLMDGMVKQRTTCVLQLNSYDILTVTICTFRSQVCG